MRSVPIPEAYVEFESFIDAAVALHLTNTVWIDRAVTIEAVNGFPGEEQFESLLENSEAAKVWCYLLGPACGCVGVLIAIGPNR